LFDEIIQSGILVYDHITTLGITVNREDEKLNYDEHFHDAKNNLLANVIFLSLKGHAEKGFYDSKMT